AEPLAEALVEPPGRVQSRQVLAEVEHARRDALRLRPRYQQRVLLLQHAAAGRAGHHDVAAGVDRSAEVLEVEARAPHGRGDVTGVERRHAAAALRGADDLDAAAPQHTDRGPARVGRIVLDRRRVEERDLAGSPDARGGRLAPEPGAEAAAILRQAP